MSPCYIIYGNPEDKKTILMGGGITDEAQDERIVDKKSYQNKNFPAISFFRQKNSKGEPGMFSTGVHKELKNQSYLVDMVEQVLRSVSL